MSKIYDQEAFDKAQHQLQKALESEARDANSPMIDRWLALACASETKAFTPPPAKAA